MFLFGRQFGQDNTDASGTISVSRRLNDLRRADEPSRPRAVLEGERSRYDGSTTTEDNNLAANLRILGLAPGASWDEITEAHQRLVSDLTPGPSASHKNVARAEALLGEVNTAYAALQLLAIA